VNLISWIFFTFILFESNNYILLLLKLKIPYVVSYICPLSFWPLANFSYHLHYNQFIDTLYLKSWFEGKIWYLLSRCSAFLTPSGCLPCTYKPPGFNCILHFSSRCFGIVWTKHAESSTKYNYIKINNTV
jgi:hypothetical protein